MAIEKLSPEVLREHKGVSFPGITTGFICYDGSGKIFLAKRSQRARDEQGRWDPGAGGLKFGQTIEGNMRRELKEEYGVEPLRTTFLGYIDVFRELSDGSPTHWLAMCFAVKVDSAAVKICEPDMFDDSGWFTLESLPSPMHSQFQKYLDHFGAQIRQLAYS